MLSRGTRVLLMFRTSVSSEGFIESWSEETGYILRTLSNDGFIIINNPKEDLIAVKIVCSSKEEVKQISNYIESTINRQNVLISNKIKEQPNNQIDNSSQADEQDENLDFKLRKLADLKIMAAKQDREIISSKLKDHSFTEMKPVTYGIPLNIKIRSK